MPEGFYWLGFSVFPGVGPATFKELLHSFGSAKDAWYAEKADLLQGGMGPQLCAKFEKFRTGFSVENYAKKLQEKKVSYLLENDKAYPLLLKQISNPPFVLYVKGHFDFNKHALPIGVVGTRRITQYGIHATSLLTEELLRAGCTIVSGLAVGVDSIAHKVTLENNGNTIAVLGCGVDCCNPRVNQVLYERIIKGSGCVVSEVPLGQPPSRGLFPSRNRIIAGLSLGVVVTEGAADSGALITADYATKNKRKVFAVPGPITSALSEGPFSLLQKGATLVTRAEDILKELGIEKTETSKKKKNVTGDTREEQTILDMLQRESLHFDEIVRRLVMDPAVVGGVLSMMEIKGMIKNTDSGIFAI